MHKDVIAFLIYFEPLSYVMFVHSSYVRYTHIQIFFLSTSPSLIDLMPLRKYTNHANNNYLNASQRLRVASAIFRRKHCISRATYIVHRLESVKSSRIITIRRGRLKNRNSSTRKYAFLKCVSHTRTYTRIIFMITGKSCAHHCAIR